MAGSLWGATFEIPETPKVAKKIIDKVKNPKDTKVSVSKAIRSSKTSDADKLVLIRENVKRKLGKYGDATQLIRTKDQLISYIDKAIQNDLIAIDTETDNSLDPISCKLMGVCIYTPGLKNVYIPINHIDITTREKLPNQLTEEDIREQFERLNVAKTKVITHNGKFDYKVLKMTTGYLMNTYWDTMIGEKILNENRKGNKPYGLKTLYREYFDPDQEKYDIEELFEGVEYAIVEPELFALYAATDAFMTYELYKSQVERYSIPDHERIRKLFLDVEMPIMTVSAEMELSGIHLDLDYAKRLSRKYADKLKEVDERSTAEVEKYRDIIEQWRQTTDANDHPIKNGKVQRSKSEQLSFPVNLESPTQLAILLYDVLKCNAVNKKKPRGTGEDELIAIYDKYKIELCNIILERRGLLKLINTYIDKLPDCLNPVDNKVHASFDQLGAGTGRFSCISKGTLISSPSGDKPIEELQPGDYVYCYDVTTNKLKISIVNHVFYNGVRPCVRLSWRSKYNHSLTGELVCTPDHMIRTTTGWVEAADLKPSDSILYVHRREYESGTALYGNFGQGNEEEHAWIRENVFNKRGSEFNIHHIDGNRHNNSLDNLMIVTPAAHNSAHMSSSLPRNKRFCGRYNYSRDELVQMCEDANWELQKIPHDFSTVVQWLQNNRINYILKYTESYSRRKYHECRGWMMKNLHLTLTKTNLAYALDLANGDTSLAASYFAVTESEFVAACDKYQLLSNHNVYKIEYLDSYPVYDIEVEKYHNFIAGELCVHNCKDPNLQNIPSKEKSIRCMFVSSPGCVLVGSDYSAQEPRLLTQFSNDPSMRDAYIQKRDLYAIIAQQAFHNDYWDNMEHHEDGSPNPEGAKRRSIAKTILLGIMYGRGCASIAEQIGSTPQEAQKIIDSFYSSFPKVKEWVQKTEKDAKVNGYVEDYWGRRRRLPDLLKPKYTITVKGEDTTLSPNFNPLLGARGFVKNTHGSKAQRWQDALSKMKSRKDYEKIKMDAAKDDVTIIDNGAFIAQAERQCVNARIQGSAATLTKLAMIEVFNDDILNKLGFKLLLAVHDELIGECPKENAEAVAERLCERMVYAAIKNGVDVPMKCDPEIEDHWYSGNLAATLHKDYNKKREKIGNDKAYEEVFKDSLFLGVPNLEKVIKEGETPDFAHAEELA